MSLGMAMTASKLWTETTSSNSPVMNVRILCPNFKFQNLLENPFQVVIHMYGPEEIWVITREYA